LMRSGTVNVTATGPNGGGAVVNNTLGANTVTMLGGTLNFLVENAAANDTAGKIYAFPNEVVLNGNATIGANRNTGTATGNFVQLARLTVGGQTVSFAQGSNYRIALNSVRLTGNPTFSPAGTVDPIIRNVSDFGAGLGLMKTGAGWMFFDGAPTLTGGLWLNADGSVAHSGGTYALGGAAVRFTNATSQAGTGRLVIGPGASMQLEGLGNVNTAAGQMIEVLSSPATRGSLVLNAALNPASVVSASSTGLLQANVGTFGTALDLATIGDGTFQFVGAVATTYSATTLGAGAGSVYRVGGNGQNITITAANANVLTGANRVQLGSMISLVGLRLLADRL
jgi:hypothetical protein